MILKNSIKIAFRSFEKNKLYSFINILGLTVGLATCMMVGTVVMNDLSYDQFWKRANELYKVNMYNKTAESTYNKQAYTPIGLGNVLKEQFQELEHYSVINSHELQLKINKDDQQAVSVPVIRGDSTLLHMLDFQFLSRGQSAFIQGETNIVITESFRNLYFKQDDPIGEYIYDAQNERSRYLISAVIKDIPQNTHLRAQAIVLDEPRIESLSKNGYSSSSKIYFLLKPGTDYLTFTKKINQWYATYMAIEDKLENTFELQPIKDVYLNSDFDDRLYVKSNMQNVYIFGAVGALILVIACINFINLSTARVTMRIKEIGLRKTLGAGRHHLIVQFLIESVFFFAISIILACILYAIAILPLESFLGHSLGTTLFSTLTNIIITIASVFILSITIGLYPAWYLSDFTPIHSLKGKLSKFKNFGPQWVRQALVTAQFTIAIIILIALLVVNQQLDYINKKDLGYNKDNLLYVARQGWEGKDIAFKLALKKIAGVKSVAIAEWDLRSGDGNIGQKLDHPLKEGEKLEAEFITADFDFPQTVGMKLLEGRFLNLQYGNDAYSIDSTWRMDADANLAYRNSRSILATRYSLQTLGVDSLGHSIQPIGYRPVGTIADLHNKSLHQSLGLLFILAQKKMETGALFIRINAGSEKTTLPAIRKVTQQFYPNKVMDIHWVSDILSQHYAAEQKQQTLFIFFSNLMLFISALGVLGLIVHTAEQRVKEIGVRKVLGASVMSIVHMLSRDFIKLACVATLIATPIAWWGMNNWLENFAFRINIPWWVFVLSGVITATVALITVGTQALRAARANPVDSLRDE